MSCRLALACVALGLVAAGCSQPGTPVSSSEAAELDVATSRISVACGYEQELTATGAGKTRGLAGIKAIASSGAQKLAAVYRGDQTGIYQGESVGAVLGDSVSLLAGCRLPDARRVLERALHARR